MQGVNIPWDQRSTGLGIRETHLCLQKQTPWNHPHWFNKGAVLTTWRLWSDSCSCLGWVDSASEIFKPGVFCSKRFSCLFERPCLFKGKSNLSMPDAFPFNSAKCFLVFVFCFAKNYVLIKWCHCLSEVEVTLSQRKSPDRNEKHEFRWNVPPQGVCPVF